MNEHGNRDGEMNFPTNVGTPEEEERALAPFKDDLTDKGKEALALIQKAKSEKRNFTQSEKEQIATLLEGAFND